MIMPRDSINSLRNLSGFTLIEILITLSIMSVLSLFGIISYREFNQSKIIDSAGHQVQDVLILARSRANTQVKPAVTACSEELEGRELYGYKVSFCSDNCATTQNFDISVLCGASGEYSQKIGNSYILPQGVTFTSSLPQSVVFKVLTGDVIGAQEIQISGYGASRVVSISQTGVISVTE